MAPITQGQLQAFWLQAPSGRLCPWAQAKALGLREAAKEVFAEDDWLGWIAARVSKVGGEHPTRSALHQFFEKVDSDPDWFPGKHNGNKRGPVPLLTPGKRRCISESAMAAKRVGDEPSVEAVLHACPKATYNPKTKQPFSPNTIRSVFKQNCYDFDSDHPWQFQTPLQKVFVSQPVREHREAMAKYLMKDTPDPAWWSQHVVWFDPCRSIIPGSQNQYDKMRQACKGHRQWVSEDARQYSANLRGPAYAKSRSQRVPIHPACSQRSNAGAMDPACSQSHPAHEPEVRRAGVVQRVPETTGRRCGKEGR